MNTNFVEELKWRGMLHDIMPDTEELLTQEMVSGYIGFDPTADSLGVGNMVQIMTLVHFQRAGHKPIALVGGATGMVGDPSGKSAERNLLDLATLNHNLESQKAQLAKFLNFDCGENSAEIVNNYDWFKEFDFLGFIRDVGKHMSVNYMMAKDSVKKRLSEESKSGMSFTEFTYQLVQGYDFLHLYQNNGYLFSNINPVEVSVENDTINFEIRVVEGKPAYFNKITVVGNTRTNDHVIYRELRTKPGNIYSKSQIVRTVRELGQMGFFDPEQISPDFKNVDPNAGTVDIEYGLVEKGASQVELQGGYGGGGFIGTLGLSFNNFSVKGLKDKAAYKPLPMGDGQALSLRLQANRFYNTASFSFSEPWLGGRQPVSFSTSISRTKQFRYDYFTGQANKDQFFEITGAQIGLAKKLRVPDDYFQLSQSIGYQYYNLSNYYTGLFTFGDGKSNNIFYQVVLARDNTFVNPVFPLGGSQFALSAKLSLPYSLFNNIDYDDLENQAEYQNEDGEPDQALIDQEKFKWLEFYKIKFNGTWYTRLVDKFVLKTHAEFGFLGAYNNKRGIIPFDRFYLGGDGMSQYAMDGRETVALRGYTNQSLSSQDGSTIYNKFSLELRYPISLKPAASIFALTFLESGNGYDNFREFNPFNAKRSAGLGVRIFMPAFGLLGIDFGYGFDSEFSGDLKAHGWETHFVIGQNF